MEKKEQLKFLYDRYCKEFDGREIVVGGGDPDCRLLLIGEAPGKDEVRLSRPFVGAAGKNLDEFLNVIELPRDKIFITNAVKYRLSAVNPKTGRKINRPATREDIEPNRQFLLDEINIIRPKLVVTLGNVPLKALTGDFALTIGTTHGTAMNFESIGAKYVLFPLYHPASIIYNRNLKDTYISDLLNLKTFITC